MIFKRILEREAPQEALFGAGDITSAAMQAAVAQWYELYYQGGPGGFVPSDGHLYGGAPGAAAGSRAQSFAQRIPYTVVDAVYHTCFGEYRAEVQGEGPAHRGAKGHRQPQGESHTTSLRCVRGDGGLPSAPTAAAPKVAAGVQGGAEGRCAPDPGAPGPDGGAEVAGGSTPKSPLLAAALQSLELVRAAAFQQALIGGEVFIKPIPVPALGGFTFAVLPRPGYQVLGRGSDGAVTAVGSREVTWQNGRQYTLLEKRTLGADGLLAMDAHLYESRLAGTLGRRVPLDRVPKYAGMREHFVLPKPVGLGMVHMKTPMANCVDGSFDGVSVFGAAAGKIVAAARHEQRCEDEYRLTRPHVIASVDLLRRGPDGELLEIPEYITPLVDDEPARAGLTVYNPVPNQGPLEARGQQHLRDIENIIGLRRGMLSSVESQERTATEVQAASARWAMTVADFCAMWRRAVEETATLCDALGQMYLGWDAAPAPALSVTFGDGVLYDADKEFERLFRMVKEGWVPPGELVFWMRSSS